MTICAATCVSCPVRPDGHLCKRERDEEAHEAEFELAHMVGQHACECGHEWGCDVCSVRQNWESGLIYVPKKASLFLCEICSAFFGEKGLVGAYGVS